MNVAVIERASRYVAKCDPAISGQGGHNSTFHVAAILVHGFALETADALSLLREYNGRCVPQWTERELKHKIESAMRTDFAEPRGYLLAASGVPSQPRRLARPCAVADAPDPVEAVRSFLKGFHCGEAELAEASPVKVDGDPRFDGSLLAGVLYRPGELINFVTDFKTRVDEEGNVKAHPVGMGTTLERDALVARFELGGSDAGQAGAWLRMNPLDGNGIADANVRSHRYALLESDSTYRWNCNCRFRQAAPASGCHYGEVPDARSMPWVKVDAPDAKRIIRGTVGRILGLLAPVRGGREAKNKNPSRLSRLPGARREIGAVGDGMQKLIYLNPNPEGRAIF